jgi:acyl carrier protein
MDNLETRLVRCFSLVFTGMDEDSIRGARIETVEEWDSMALVTLINVVEEEFGVRIEPEELEELGSFRQFLEYLRPKVAA